MPILSLVAAKRCSRCGENKPLTKFRFTGGLSGGRRSACQECENAYRPPAKEYPSGRKRCTKCREEKALAAFGSHFKNGLQSQCKACLNVQLVAYNKKWQRANPGRYAERCRRDVKKWRAANPEKVTAKNKRYRAKHPERQRAADRRWARAHPEKCRAKCAVRQARLRGAAGKFTGDDLKRIYLEQGGLCYYCKLPLGGKYHAEHKIPVSRGGSNDPVNIACACARCNLRKRTKTAAEFLELLRAG